MRRTQDVPRADLLRQKAREATAKKAAAVVQTGEGRLYANIILKKGIIRPDAA